MSQLFLQSNTELFKVSGVLTLILYILETLKEGYVSFFVNPAWFLVLFVVSGVVWLFSPDKVEK